MLRFDDKLVVGVAEYSQDASEQPTGLVIRLGAKERLPGSP